MLVPNKTGKLLLPIFNIVDREVLKAVSRLVKFNISIHDFMYDSLLVKYRLFIRVSINYTYMEHNNDINRLRVSKYLVEDFAYEGSSRMFIFDLSSVKLFRRAFDNFILGNYSEMYDDNILALIIPPLYNGREAKIQRLLRPTSKRVEQHRNRIYNTFNGVATEVLEDIHEGDFAPKIREEILNYNPNDTRVFVNTLNWKEYESNG